MTVQFAQSQRSIVREAATQECHHQPSDQFRWLLHEAFARTGKPVRLIGLGVRFASTEQDETQLPLL